MSKPNKLDLTIEKLKEIAQSINKNTAANRNKSKEDKISTDKFIKQFGINRKDFSEMIKDTNIKYNKSTFIYNTEGSRQLDFLSKKVDLGEVIQSNEKTTVSKPLVKQEVYQITTQSSSNEIQSIPKNTLQLPNELKEILSLTEELKEMLGWYRKQANTNTSIKIPAININIDKLDGEVVTRSFKIYKEIAEDFSNFAVSRKETQKELISLALLEFIKKYK